MTRRIIGLIGLLATCALTGCTSMPIGPSMMALPGSGRSFDQFRYDDYACRQYAYEQIGGLAPNDASISSGIGSAAIGAGLGAAAGAALGGGRGAAIGAGTGLVAGGLVGARSAGTSGYVSQQRYDMGYTQCMYGKGHRVPVYGQVQNSANMSGSQYNNGPHIRSPYPPYPNVRNMRRSSLQPPPPPPPGISPPPPPR
jgi:hypothetical protein